MDSITSLTSTMVNLDSIRSNVDGFTRSSKIPFKPLKERPSLRATSTSRYSKIWEEMCEHFDNSMSAQIQSSKISIPDVNTSPFHRRKPSLVLANWAEQSRLYNEMAAKEEFTDNQLISFLNTCVSGTPNLSQVLPRSMPRQPVLKPARNPSPNMLHDSLNRPKF
jgi:hypothetical protein